MEPGRRPSDRGSQETASDFASAVGGNCIVVGSLVGAMDLFWLGSVMYPFSPRDIGFFLRLLGYVPGLASLSVLLAAGVLLVGGIGLRRSHEWARRALDSFAWIVVVAGSGLLPLEYASNWGVKFSLLWTPIFVFWPLLIWVAVIAAALRLKGALWDQRAIEACGGQATIAGSGDNRVRRLKLLLAMALAFAVGTWLGFVFPS